MPSVRIWEEGLGEGKRVGRGSERGGGGRGDKGGRKGGWTEEGVEEGELGGAEARRLGLKGCGGEDRGVGKDGQELEGGGSGRVELKEQQARAFLD